MSKMKACVCVCGVLYSSMDSGGGSSSHSKGWLPRFRVSRSLMILWLYLSSIVTTFIVVVPMVGSLDMNMSIVSQTASNCSDCTQGKQSR